MKNVLLVITTPGGDGNNCCALIPEDRLEGINLNQIDNKIVNVDDDEKNEWIDQIVTLYKRLGLENQKENVVPVDLAEYLNPQPPFTVSKIVYIGWAV